MIWIDLLAEFVLLPCWLWWCNNKQGDQLRSVTIMQVKDGSALDHDGSWDVYGKWSDSKCTFKVELERCSQCHHQYECILPKHVVLYIFSKKIANTLKLFQSLLFLSWTNKSEYSPTYLLILPLVLMVPSIVLGSLS